MSGETPRSALWPDAGTLAGSRLADSFRRWIEAPGVDRAQAYEVLLAVLMRYACGECLFLADAVAKVCARPHHVVEFTMPGPDGDTRLAHAVLCVGADKPRAETKGYDILGVSPLGEIARGLSRLGPITWGVMPVEDRPRLDEIAEGGAETALRVAGCLPWLAGHVPARYRIPDSCALACLTEIVGANSRTP